MRSHLSSLKDLKNFFNGIADSVQINELRTQLRNLLAPIELQRLLPRSGPSPPGSPSPPVHQPHRNTPNSTC